MLDKYVLMHTIDMLKTRFVVTLCTLVELYI